MPILLLCKLVYKQDHRIQVLASCFQEHARVRCVLGIVLLCRNVIKMIFIWYPILLLTLLTCITVAEESMVANKSVSKILSRRKRFLIFPDGSSFQLVFCTQNHGYLQIGNIVWFGTTAALAWELPTDPNLFYMFKDQYKFNANRKSDVIYYLDEEGKVVDKKNYKRKIIVNPAFAKRSIDSIKEENRGVTNMLKKEMHKKQKNINHLEELDATEIDFHRKGRQKLYVKLEKFLQALGYNGKECISQMICQASKLEKADQGTFLDEILRAVFTLPKLHVQPEVHNQYDDAHGANGDCAHLYPNCEHSPMT